MFGLMRTHFFTFFCIYLVLTFDGSNGRRHRKGYKSKLRHRKHQTDKQIERLVETMKAMRSPHVLKKATTLDKLTLGLTLLRTLGLKPILTTILAPVVKELKMIFDILNLSSLFCSSGDIDEYTATTEVDNNAGGYRASNRRKKLRAKVPKTRDSHLETRGAAAEPPLIAASAANSTEVGNTLNMAHNLPDYLMAEHREKGADAK